MPEDGIIQIGPELADPETGIAKDPLLLEQPGEEAKPLLSPFPEISHKITTPNDGFISQSERDEIERPPQPGLVDPNITTPEKEAEIQRLADETGLPTEFVRENPPNIERQAKNNKIQGHLRQSPKLSELMSNPDFQRFITEKDVESLSRLEQTLLSPAQNNQNPFEGIIQPKEPTLTERLVDDVGLNLISGSVRLVQQPNTIFQMAGNALFGEDFRESTPGQFSKFLDDKFFNESIDALEEVRPQSILEEKRRNDSFLPTVSDVIKGGAELAPQLPVLIGVAFGARALALRAGASATAAGLIGGAATGLTFATTEVYRDTVLSATAFLEGKVDANGQRLFTDAQVAEIAQRTAFYAVSINAIPAAALGSFGIGSALLVRGQLITRALKGGMVAFIPEGLSEAWEEVSTELGLLLAADPEVGEDRRDVFSEENLKQFSQAGIIGGVLGLGIGGSVSSLNELASVQKGRENKEIFEAIADPAQNGDLAKNIPRYFQNYMDTIVKDGEKENVYMKVEELKTEFRKQGVEPAKVFQSMGDGVLEEALTNPTGFISMKTGEFAKNVASNPELFDVVLPHITFDPNIKTPAEVETYDKEQARTINEISKEIEEANVNNLEFKQNVEAVRSDMHKRFAESEALPKNISDVNTELYVASAIAFSSRLKNADGSQMTPLQFHEKFAPRITGQKAEFEAGETLEQRAAEITETPEFKEFFEGSKVVDESGEPLVVFHGTTEDFNVFDESLGGENTGSDGFLGRGFYFSTSPSDAGQFGSNIMPVFLQVKNPLNLDVTNTELAKKIPKLAFKNGEKVIDAVKAIKEIDSNISEISISEENKNGFVNVQYKFNGEWVSIPQPKSKVEILNDNGRGVAIEHQRIAQGINQVEGIGALGNAFGANNFREAVIEAGFDGVISSGTNIGDRGKEIVVFNPQQIKSIFNRGTFDPSNPNILFQQEAIPEEDINPQWYFSTLLESVQTLKESKRKPKPAREWEKILTALPGVKKEEIEYTGLMDFLRLHSDKDFAVSEAQVEVDFAEGALERATMFAVPEQVEAAEKRQTPLDKHQNHYIRSRNAVESAKAKLEATKNKKLPNLGYNEILSYLKNKGVRVVDVMLGEPVALDINAPRREMTEEERDTRIDEIKTDLISTELVERLSNRAEEELTKEVEEKFDQELERLKGENESNIFSRLQELQKAEEDKNGKFLSLQESFDLRVKIKEEIGVTDVDIENQAVIISEKLREGDRLFEIEEEFRETVEDELWEDGEIHQQAIDLFEEEEGFTPQNENRTKFAQYTLPGGEYRELLITFPDAKRFFKPVDPQVETIKDKIRAWIRDKEAARFVETIQNEELGFLAWYEVFRNSALKGADITKNVLSDFELRIFKSRQSEFTPSDNDFISGDTARNEFVQSSHFEQPNIVAHVRFKEREGLIGAESQRMTEIIEAQGKLQDEKAGLVGFAPAGEVESRNRRIADIDSIFTQLATEFVEEKRKLPNKKVLFIEEIQSDWATALRKWNKDKSIDPPPRGPFINSTQDYTTLAVKRMIAYAMEHGFDRIEWKTPAQQGSRYNLNQYVSGISWNPKTRTLYAKQQGQNEFSVIQENVPAEDLPEFVGEEVAANLLATKASPISSEVDQTAQGEKAAELKELGPNDSHTLTGDKIRTIDKNQNTYYGKILPDVVAKTIKKLGAGKQDLKNKGEPSVNEYSPTDQPGFDIGPIKKSLQTNEGLVEKIALFQKEGKGEGARGFFQFDGDITKDASVIGLLENANLSTYLHETGHFYFEVIRTLASQVDAPPDIKKDMDTLLEFLGVSDLTTWNNMSLEERRNGHERIARGFERYLFEGRAPSLELQGLFNRFLKWLNTVYESIIGLNQEAGFQVNLSDEVRGVFDRMLATKEQIAIAKDNELIRPLPFDGAEEAQVDPKQWESYQQNFADVDETAQQELGRRLNKDMRWLSRARSRTLRKLQKENRDKREGVEAGAITEIGALRVYRLREFLAKPVEKKPQRKSHKTEVTPEVDSLFTAIGKLGGLNKQEVVDQFGHDPKDKINSRVGQPVLRAKDGGIAIDKMAELLAQDGYLPLDENGKPDVIELEERFLDENRGVHRYSVANDRYESSEEMEALAIEFYNANDIQVGPEGGKLSLTALQDTYGFDEGAIWRSLKRGRYGYVANEGLDPELVAELHGYRSADEMLNELAQAPSFRDAVSAETDKRMMQIYGDINSRESMEAAADKALGNDVRTRILHTEMTILSQRAGSANILRDLAKERAQLRINRTKIKNLKPNNFKIAAAKARRATEKALKKGDNAEAAKQKRFEILNHHHHRAALAAREQAEKTAKGFRKFRVKATQRAIGQSQLDQIETQLEKYELKTVPLTQLRRREALSEWIAQQQKEGFEPDLPANIIAESNKKNWKELTVEELAALKETIDIFEHSGRLKNKLIAAAKARTLAEAVSGIVAEIEENSKGKRPEIKEPRLQPEELSRDVESLFASHRKMSSKIFEMGGFKFGLMHELIVRPLNERSAWQIDQNRIVNEKMVELYNLYSVVEMGAMGIQKFHKEIDDSISKEALLVIALNKGTERNWNRVKQGLVADREGWTESGLEAVLDKFEKRDWDFVQGVWDLLDTYWEPTKQKAIRVNGVAPTREEAVPVQTRHGTYPGGYYGLKYEERQDIGFAKLIEADAAKKMMQGGLGRATTKRGREKDRLDEVKRPIRQDFGWLHQQFQETIHDLAFHEYLVDVNRIMGHEDVRSAIRDHHGDLTLGSINRLIKDVAAGDVEFHQTMDRVFTFTRSGAAIAAMGMNFGVAALQPFGISNSMARVGPKWIFKGMGKWLSSGENMENTAQWISDKSPTMKNRIEGLSLTREITEIRSKVGKRGKRSKEPIVPQFIARPADRILSPIDDSYFYIIAKMQMTADIPTWLGAYWKEMENPANIDSNGAVDEGRAIAIADQTVLDTQGAGEIKDQAEIQRGSPAYKLWTMYYTYFAASWQLTAETYGKNIRGGGWKNPYQVGRFAADFFFLYIMPAILTSMVLGVALKGACGGLTNPDFECMGKKFAEEEISYMMGMFIYAREAGGFAAGFYDWRGPAGATLLSNAGKFARQASQMEVDAAFMKALNNLSGVYLHYPAGQINKTADGLAYILEGNADKPLSILFGVPDE